MKETTVQLFKPHEGQRKVINGFADTPHKFGIVSTGRQFGKSLLAENILAYWLLNNPNSKGAWITPVYAQGRKVFQEVVKALHPILESVNKAELSIKFKNGSSLIFLSSERPDSIRGYSFTHMIVDEAAYVRKEAFYESILPTLTAIGKKCLIISTPAGKGNWLYEWYLRGISENNTYVSYQGISSDNPYVDKNFIEEQKKSLPLEIYQQEYEAAFVDGGNDVFSNLTNVCILDEWPTISRSENYFAGIDVGISDDYTVLTILSSSGRVCSITRLNRRPIAEIGRLLTTELKRYPNISGYCELNGVGRAVYEEVRRDVRTIRGFTTNNDNKVQAIRGLIQDMEEGVIELPSKKLMPEVFQEFASFTYKLGQNGKLHFSHPPGMHDDIVDSIWMANVARNELKGGASSKIYVGNSKAYFR